MANIFLSYSRDDGLWASRFASRLAEHGWSIFWDQRIPIGAAYREVIQRELDSSECVIVLWSRSSVVSRWVQNEADVAAQRDMLCPVLIEDVPPPLGLQAIQTASLVGWDPTSRTSNTTFDALVAKVATMVGRKVTTHGREAPAAIVMRERGFAGIELPVPEPAVLNTGIVEPAPTVQDDGTSSTLTSTRRRPRHHYTAAVVVALLSGVALVVGSLGLGPGRRTQETPVFPVLSPNTPAILSSPKEVTASPRSPMLPDFPGKQATHSRATVRRLDVASPTSPSQPEAATFHDNMDGTVTNMATRQVWQRSYEFPVSRSEAEKRCLGKALGGSDRWRLPTVAELKTLLVSGKEDPAISSVFDPITSPQQAPASQIFWTSERLPSGRTRVVSLYKGVVDEADDQVRGTARCVRQ